MVLNSLEIDPKRTWKGAWRWYSTDLLQACSSPNQIQSRGITFTEFACLARNHCHVTEHKPSSTVYSTFLSHLTETTSNAETHMVVSFSRKALGQTSLKAKTGFAPIGGYNPLQNKVLLMDSSRSEYPCVWVDAALLYRAMAEIDPLLQSERGYFLLAQGQQLETRCTCPKKC
jgi:glutathione gamma-glutamylcysteinyltransferase